MNEIFAAALELQQACVQREWKICFIGGVSVQRWGEPRFTADVDLTLLTGFGDEEKFISALIGVFSPRRADASEFALRNRVLLLKAGNGIPLDVALGAFPFEERSIQRASPFLFPPGQTLITCSAEDLVVHKVFAGREKDWLDVATVLSRQSSKLNLPLIRRELKPLLELKEQDSGMARFEKLVEERRIPDDGR